MTNDPMPAEPQRFTTGRRATAAGFLTLAVGLLTAAAAHAQTAWQAPESIRVAAREYVLAAVGGDATVEVGIVDDRLKLPACSAPLAAAAQGALRAGSGTIAVSCAGERPWRLFVSVRTIRAAEVLVLRRDVRAGESLTAADVALQSQPTASLPYQYLVDPAEAVGFVLRRSLPAGAVLVPAALDRPELVERGALVTLVSGSGPVSVRTEGVALEAARAHQRVRVRSPSGRVVEGIVADNGEIRIGGPKGSP